MNKKAFKMPTRNSRMLRQGRSAKPCSRCGKIPNN